MLAGWYCIFSGERPKSAGYRHNYIYAVCGLWAVFHLNKSYFYFSHCFRIIYYVTFFLSTEPHFFLDFFFFVEKLNLFSKTRILFLSMFQLKKNPPVSHNPKIWLSIRLVCLDDCCERRPVVRRRLHDDPDGWRKRDDCDERSGSGGGGRT